MGIFLVCRGILFLFSLGRSSRPYLIGKNKDLNQDEFKILTKWIMIIQEIRKDWTVQAFFSAVDMEVLFLSGLGQYLKFSFICKIGKIAFAAKIMHYLT